MLASLKRNIDECHPGKILQQLIGPNSPIPIEILTQGRPKDPPTNAIPTILEVLSSSVCNTPVVVSSSPHLDPTQKRIGTLTKEQHTGRLIDEWKTALDAHPHKFDNVDISASLSACMAVKDDEELVRFLNRIVFAS